jgi:hypothetical protein
MNPYMVFFSVWGIVTLACVALFLYRASITSHESDWIPLTNDAAEDRAIQSQTALELRTQKLTWPIRGLFATSILLLVVILGYWLYEGFTTQPAP